MSKLKIRGPRTKKKATEKTRSRGVPHRQSTRMGREERFSASARSHFSLHWVINAGFYSQMLFCWDLWDFVAFRHRFGKMRPPHKGLVCGSCQNDSCACRGTVARDSVILSRSYDSPSFGSAQEFEISMMSPHRNKGCGNDVLPTGSDREPCTPAFAFEANVLEWNLQAQSKRASASKVKTLQRILD